MVNRYVFFPFLFSCNDIYLLFILFKSTYSYMWINWPFCISISISRWRHSCEHHLLPFSHLRFSSILSLLSFSTKLSLTSSSSIWAMQWGHWLRDPHRGQNTLWQLGQARMSRLPMKHTGHFMSPIGAVLLAFVAGFLFCYSVLFQLVLKLQSRMILANPW